MSTIQRITGTNSGLDVDTLVKQSLQSYQTRIDKETQNKMVFQYQQEQYKQIMSDASSFYDKYFDVLKTGNLLSESTYQTEKFTPSDDGSKVTAKGLAGASLDNYTVSVTQLASTATTSLNMGDTNQKIIQIGTAQVTFDVVPNGVTTVSNYNKAIEAEKSRLNGLIANGTTLDTDGKSVNSKLSDLNSNTITAKYSEFSNNVTFTASQFGQGGFSILNSTTKAVEQTATDKYLEATIKNSSGKVYSISTADKRTSNNVTIDNVQFDLKGIATSTTPVPAGAATKATPLTEPAKLAGLTELSDLSVTLTDLEPLPDDETTTTAADGTKTTTKTASDGTKTVTIKTSSSTTTTETKTDGTITTTTETSSSKATTETKADGTKTTKSTSIATDTTTGAVTTTTLAQLIQNGTTTTTTSKNTTTNGTTTTSIATSNVEADGTTTTTTTNKTNGMINNITNNITIPYDGSSPISKQVIKDYSTSPASITTTTALKSGNDITTQKTIYDGTTNKTTVTTTARQTLADGSTSTTTETTVDGTITDSTTANLLVNADGSTTKTVTTTQGGVTTTTASNYTQTSLTGGTDVSALKDKIVGFVNDYNNLLKEINTKLWEKRDTNYMPLTDEQKKSMTDSQITAWEKKAQTGLLRKDSDLERITREMKSAMSSVMSGTGLYLEKIGISPVDDYTDKNGMLTIDEDKLTTALEENGGNVEDLFLRSSDTSSSQGIIRQLKDVLKSEFKTSISSLSKKAGYAGSVTEYDNTLTNNINTKTTLIKKLNTQLSDKENVLYKKYSNLEAALQTLNSQQSSLASMLGQS